MINMKLDKTERKEHDGCAVECESPEYPYGLSICLNTESMEKLGITELPEVGSQMVLTAQVVVTSVGMHSRQEGEKDRNVDLQITDMELAAERPDPAQTLYG